MDKTLMNLTKELADKERKIKEFKNRLRCKGRVTGITYTKKGHLKLTLKNKRGEFSCIILRTHMESYILAQKASIGTPVSIQAIPKLRMNICTKLKILTKFDESNQTCLRDFS